MDKTEVQERVIKITSSVLGVPAEDITLESTFSNDLGAESIQSIQLVEDEFDIEMDEDDALSVTRIDKAVDFIHKVVLEQHG